MDLKLCAHRGCCRKTARGQKYCSKAHAPYGNLVDDIESVMMAQSSFKELGDRFKQSKEGELRAKRDGSKPRPNQNSEKNITNLNEPSTGRIWINPAKKPATDGTASLLIRNEDTENWGISEKLRIVPELEPIGETPMLNVETIISEKNMSAEINVTQPEDFNKPSETLKQVKSHSMTLIDESTQHLKDLMRSVKPQQSEVIKTQEIQAACNCAAQISKLIRLKLDIIKTRVQ